MCVCVIIPSVPRFRFEFSWVFPDFPSRLKAFEENYTYNLQFLAEEMWKISINFWLIFNILIITIKFPGFYDCGNPGVLYIGTRTLWIIYIMQLLWKFIYTTAEHIKQSV